MRGTGTIIILSKRFQDQGTGVLSKRFRDQGIGMFIKIKHPMDAFINPGRGAFTFALFVYNLFSCA
jgi:hypothetical protein